MKSIAEIVKQDIVAFVSAIGTIILVQAPHLGVVFSQMSQFEEPWSYVHGVAYAISIDLGVLFFAVRGKVLQTVIFMIISAIITVRYYIDFILEADWFGILSMILIGITPSILVFFISTELDVKEESVDDKILKLRNGGYTYDQIVNELKDFKVSKDRINKVINGQK